MPRRSTMKQDDILATECKKLNIPFEECTDELISWCNDPNNKDVMMNY